MKDKLQRASELDSELNKIKEEISPLLIKYANKCIHRNLEDIRYIEFGDNYVSFTISGYAYGYFKENGEVTWDYFDNPDEYIKKELNERK